MGFGVNTDNFFAIEQSITVGIGFQWIRTELDFFGIAEPIVVAVCVVGGGAETNFTIIADTIIIAIVAIVTSIVFDFLGDSKPIVIRVDKHGECGGVTIC